MKAHLSVFAFLFVVLSAVVIGCSDEEDDRERLARMEQEILDYVGTPVCEGVSNCRFIGVGAKPCGGPWYWLIYSTVNVDSLRLAGMVTAYNEYNEDLNRKYGWVSDCSVPNVPDLDCQGGRCVDAAKAR